MSLPVTLDMTTLQPDPPPGCYTSAELDAERRRLAAERLTRHEHDVREGLRLRALRFLRELREAELHQAPEAQRLVLLLEELAGGP